MRAITLCYDYLGVSSNWRILSPMLGTPAGQPLVLRLADMREGRMCLICTIAGAERKANDFAFIVLLALLASSQCPSFAMCYHLNANFSKNRTMGNAMHLGHERWQSLRIVGHDLLSAWPLPSCCAAMNGKKRGWTRKVGRQIGSWKQHHLELCLLYTSPSPRDGLLSRMPSSA